VGAIRAQPAGAVLLAYDDEHHRIAFADHNVVFEPATRNGRGRLCSAWR
jgi:hypothetical protein